MPWFGVFGPGVFFKLLNGSPGRDSTLLQGSLTVPWDEPGMSGL